MSEILLDKVCKVLKGQEVLTDISLSMHPGIIYGLKGKNGCGKTMLMRTICGLLIPSSGTITIDGEILHQDIEFPRSIGALIENPAFLHGMTGLKNLKMLASLDANFDESNICLALERVGLDPRDTRTYRKYSLGMKQKLGIANAIMGEPDIIILDEPINALDEESVRKIREVLKGIAANGKTIIVACHDRDELEYLCDAIYEIKEGRIVGMEVLDEENLKVPKA